MRHEQFEIEVNAIDGTVHIHQDGLLDDRASTVVLSIGQIHAFIAALRKEISRPDGDE